MNVGLGKRGGYCFFRIMLIKTNIVYTQRNQLIIKLYEILIILAQKIFVRILKSQHHSGSALKTEYD